MSSGIETALAPLIGALQADGYNATVEESGDSVLFRISAGPEACAECLSPRAVMAPIVTTALREAGYRHAVQLQYPPEHHEA